MVIYRVHMSNLAFMPSITDHLHFAFINLAYRNYEKETFASLYNRTSIVPRLCTFDVFLNIILSKSIFSDGIVQK